MIAEVEAGIRKLQAPAYIIVRSQERLARSQHIKAIGQRAYWQVYWEEAEIKARVA